MAESALRMTIQVNDPITDELSLIQAAREDPRAFGELYNRYVERVFKYLFSRLGNLQDAEDITSQTFLTAFEAFNRYRQDGRFASWLFTIARNKVMDHFRKRKSLPTVEEVAEIPELHDPLGDIIQSERSAALRELILALPDEKQELLRLRFLAQMSYPEIAHLLHRNEDTVKKTTYRILARLHSQLEVSNE